MLKFPCKVKCVDNSGAISFLVVGKIYTATGYNPYANQDFLIEEAPRGIISWQKKRFIVMEKNCSITSSLFHECPCGIVRNQCDYHR